MHKPTQHLLQRKKNAEALKKKENKKDRHTSSQMRKKVRQIIQNLAVAQGVRIVKALFDLQLTKAYPALRALHKATNSNSGKLS